MPDIHMCHGENCERKETCYRYTATPNPYSQSYFTSVPKPCGYYIECKGKGQTRRLDIQCEGGI